jgi:hypothetical protein
MDVLGFLCVSPGSSTVQLCDNLGSRRAFACSEAGFSSALGVYYRRAAHNCIFSCGQKTQCKGYLDRNVSVTVGSVCRIKRFTAGAKYFADDEEVETEVRKWLRQQSKTLTLVKRRDKCINVGGGYVEK